MTDLKSSRQDKMMRVKLEEDIIFITCFLDSFISPPDLAFTTSQSFLNLNSHNKCHFKEQEARIQALLASSERHRLCKKLSTF